MKSKLKIYTSYVSPKTLESVVEKNLLPIFILRCIYKSGLIGKYSDSAIHFKVLSPSDLLYRSFRDGEIGKEEFEKKYIIEMSSVNFTSVIRKLEYLAELSGASGVVLMGYENDGHRRVLSDLLNESHLLETEIKEI